MRGKRDHSRERSLRHRQTDAEARLWRYLRDRNLGGHKFRRQHKIGAYAVDLVCPDAKLIVEVAACAACCGRSRQDIGS